MRKNLIELEKPNKETIVLCCMIFGLAFLCFMIGMCYSYSTATDSVNKYIVDFKMHNYCVPITDSFKGIEEYGTRFGINLSVRNESNT